MAEPSVADHHVEAEHSMIVQIDGIVVTAHNAEPTVPTCKRGKDLVITVRISPSPTGGAFLP